MTLVTHIHDSIVVEVTDMSQDKSGFPGSILSVLDQHQTPMLVLEGFHKAVCSGGEYAYNHILVKAALEHFGWVLYKGWWTHPDSVGQFGMWEAANATIVLSVWPKDR